MLYEYLNKFDVNNKYSERIGLMLIKVGKFSSALEILKNIDTFEGNYQCGRMYLHGEGTAQDLEEAKKYFEKNMNKIGEFDNYELKILEKTRKDYQKTCDWIKNQNKRFQKGSYSKVVNDKHTGSSSCCYIITATCMALGINRDEEFFKMLKKFRNSYLKENLGKNTISEYYRVSPKIADKIDREWNPFIIYRELWDDYIKPSLNKMKIGAWEDSKKIYNEMMKNLCEFYSVEVEDFVAKKYNIKII